jgi:hypothetical protein
MTVGTSDGIVRRPLPEAVFNKPMPFPAKEADKLLPCFAPRYPVKMPWFPTDVANIAPMPIAAGNITGHVMTRFSERIRLVKGMDPFTIFTDHMIHLDKALIGQRRKHP